MPINCFYCFLYIYFAKMPLAQVSKGLWKKYGDQRVVDTPITEMGFAGELDRSIVIVVVVDRFRLAICSRLLWDYEEMRSSIPE